MKSRITTLVIVFALLIPFVFGKDVDNELAEYEKAKKEIASNKEMYLHLKTLAHKVDAPVKKTRPMRDVPEIYDVSSFMVNGILCE